MKTFMIRGDIELSQRYKIPLDNWNDNDYNEIITDSDTITVYLDQGRTGEEYYGDILKNYHKIYTSDDGFSLENILNLIHKTYQACKKEVLIPHDNERFLDNLNISGFKFDSVTNTVYPKISS